MKLFQTVRLLTAKQSRTLDAISEDLGIPTSQLMENAGKAVAAEIQKRNPSHEKTILIFSGKGNNGGDAKVAASILKKNGYDVALVSPETDLASLAKQLSKVSWVIDGLLGTGLKGNLRGWYAEAIFWINQSGKKVLSIDIPSGLSADTGKPLGVVVKADVTLCLGDLKLGVVLYPGATFAGEVVVADIGIPLKAYEKLDLPFFYLEPNDFVSVLKKRDLAAHKGNFGHVGVIAGSLNMPGSGFLSSLASLRAGAGRVTYCLPKTAYQKFDSHFSEVMVFPVEDEAQGFFVENSAHPVLEFCEKVNSVVLGPGLGREKSTGKFVHAILKKISKPVVLDADGIYALSQKPDVLKVRQAPTIFTPHPGEMGFLLRSPATKIEEDRIHSVQQFLKQFPSSVVLKGFRSLIGFPDGKIYVNPTGNPGMATAGMGDVLAGILGGLLAQGFPLKEAALFGVYLHGLAGDMAREKLGEKGLIASDTLSYLPKALHLLEERFQS